MARSFRELTVDMQKFHYMGLIGSSFALFCLVIAVIVDVLSFATQGAIIIIFITSLIAVPTVVMFILSRRDLYASLMIATITTSSVTIFFVIVWLFISLLSRAGVRSYSSVHGAIAAAVLGACGTGCSLASAVLLFRYLKAEDGAGGDIYESRDGPLVGATGMPNQVGGASGGYAPAAPVHGQWQPQPQPQQQQQGQQQWGGQPGGGQWQPQQPQQQPGQWAQPQAHAQHTGGQPQ
jgi:hypothetical protein